MAHTYRDAHQQPRLYSNGPNFGLNVEQAYAINQEMILQQQILAASLLSPTHHPRQDSLFNTSPSASPKSGVSPHQHQAVPQPYVPATQPTSNTFGYFPVTMQRSASHYSIASGQQQQQARQHRQSYDNASMSQSAGMSRSSTQHSIRSIGNQYQADSQPRGVAATSAHSYSSSVAAYTPTTSESHSWPFNGVYDASLVDDAEGSAAGLNGVGYIFGQEATSSKYVYPLMFLLMI